MADGVVSCVVGNEQSEQMLLRLLVDPGCAVDVVGALVGPGFEINSPVPFEPDFCVTIVHTAASAVSPLPLPPRLSTLMCYISYPSSREFIPGTYFFVCLHTLYANTS